MFVQTGRLDRTDRDDPAVMNLDAISKFPSRRFGLLQTWLIVLKVNLLYRKRDCKHEDQPGLLPVSPSQKSSKVSQRAKIVVQLVSCKIMLQSPRLRFSSTFLKMKKLLFSPEEWLSGCGLHGLHVSRKGCNIFGYWINSSKKSKGCFLARDSSPS